MIQIDNKKNCVGCTACASICQKNCVQMETDKEGFQYPIVDMEKCVQCGACEKVCPMKNSVKEEVLSQKAFLVQHRDDDIRLDSSAGGAFTAIATVVLERGGVVFGAAYDDSFYVRHTYVEKIADLKKFRNSKYVQSDMGECFKQTKRFLKENRWVCFSGTPCQIEGLFNFLGKRYDRLILVDVVCHGIPSPLIFRKYLECQGITEKKPDNIRFRDKFYGYKYSTMSVIWQEKNIYHAGSQLDPMLRAFFADICDRPSCYDCSFKKRYRISDLTLWDCFSVSDFDREMDDDKGTTRVLCHTEKGAAVIQEIEKFAKCKEVLPDKLVAGVKEMMESVQMNPLREVFLADAQTLSGTELFAKYYPITWEVKVNTWIRKAFLMTGAYGAVKKCLNKMRGR